jgi:hypothetical protein
MALVSASIPNLINGVSQQPPSLRLKTQADLQENGLSSVVSGLSKRPPTEHIASLGNISGADNAFIHTIRRDENEFYTLVVTTDNVYVFDKDGTSKTVYGSAAYLSGLTNPSQEVAATTVADYTFILNKNTTVTKNTTVSSSRPNEALLYVKQGDYRCQYTVRITKGGNVYTRSIETMSSTQDTTTATSNAERSIQTDRIANNLNYFTATETTYYGSVGAGSIPGMSVTQYGNVLYYQSTDGNDFDIEVEDSRGSQHLLAFKNQTADFDDLPPNGPEGFVIGVVGDNDKGQDDYYVELQIDDNGGQVWKETIKPNIETELNASTMPHQLVRRSDGDFDFQQATYASRKVGDDDTNPFPSFVGFNLADIFFHRNRLGVLADENVIFSEAGQFEEFNFFQRTTLTLLDSDPIDVAVSNNKVSLLRHAVPFTESLLLFSDLTQFRLDATDLLTPETVSIDVTTQFEASLRAKPVGAGRYVFFATKRGKYSGVREYFVDLDTEVDDAADITAHVPSYILGEVKKMEASSNEDMLICLTANDPTAMYVYRYYWQGNEKLQSSWSRWVMSGNVLNVSFNKSEIFVLVKYDTGVFLERINLSEDDATEVTSAGHGINLDRRVKLTSGGTTTVPYTSDNIVYVTHTGRLISDTGVSNALSSGLTVYAGIPYTFRYRFSEQVLKNNNEPMTTGRLQLRNWNVVYSDTGFFQTEVTPTARPTKTAKFTGRLVGSSANILGQVAIENGTFRFGVNSNSQEVNIELVSDSHLPCSFQSAEWEGFFVLRSRRL